MQDRGWTRSARSVIMASLRHGAQADGPLRAHLYEAAPENDVLTTNPEVAISEAWNNYADIIEEVESSLIEIKVLGGKEAGKHRGRVEGPQFCSATVANRCTSAIGGRSNPVSRAWRLSHGWLTTTAKSSSDGNMERARRRLLKYKHDINVDDPHLQEGKQTILAWQAGLSDWMLRHDATLEAIRAHAGKWQTTWSSTRRPELRQSSPSGCKKGQPRA